MAPLANDIEALQLFELKQNTINSLEITQGNTIAKFIL